MSKPKANAAPPSVTPRRKPPASATFARQLPVGAEVQKDGSVHFRVWAPKSTTVHIELPEVPSAPRALTAEGDGYFSGVVPEAKAGARYRYRLDSGSFPDPASRFQPEGPHGPSEVVDPSKFTWTDQAWKGRPRSELVLYELHLGTFTPEGTWAAARAQLPELAALGITAVEIMPIAEFPGQFGWGYDGVDLFAPARLYGRPEEVSAFIDQAHTLGLMVILDVVYNHLGPDGNYLAHFSEDYFSRQHQSEWGRSLNFDGENCGPVREFFLANAAYWIREYHFDGLRLDATQQIFDDSPTHLLQEIGAAVRTAAWPRLSFVVAENESQETRLVTPVQHGGFGLDAIWNDDLHHSAIVAATGRREAYYSDYCGSAQEFISSAKYGFLYQGQWYEWQQKRRGQPSSGLEPEQFVVFLQNHDQVANSLRGHRLHELTSAGRLKALTAINLLFPGTPMLFQGQEFGATTPFLYFADHQAELSDLVRQGRRKFLDQFRSIATEECRAVLSQPGDRSSFERCKLDFGERVRHAELYALHRDLLRLRREDAAIHRPSHTDGAVLRSDAFVLRYFNPGGNDRLLLVNLGQDCFFSPAPEPLLAPLRGRGWSLLWSSQATEYGGCGTPPLETVRNWVLPAESAVVLKPADNAQPAPIRLTDKA